MSEENIRRYSADELRELRARDEVQTDWEKADSITDEELERLIAADADEAELEWDWENLSIVMPENKQQITLRVDADVLRFFKQGGKGYQTRMNAVLRAYMLKMRELEK